MTNGFRRGSRTITVLRRRRLVRRPSPAARRVANALPDSFVVQSTRLQALSKIGKLLNVAPYLNGDKKWKSSFSSDSFRSLRGPKGEMWGIAEQRDVVGIYYNKSGTVAETYGIPVAPHDCTGPVVLTASTHLSLHLPNAPLQETVRAYYTGWYRDLVSALPTIENGRITPPEGPGLGTSLLPEVHERADAHLRSSTFAHVPV